MASINVQKYTTDAAISVANLGYYYDVTGMTAQSKPTPDGSTVFNVIIPAGYTYNEGFLFFLTADPHTAVDHYTVDDTTTPGTLIVTCASNSNLAASTAYTMSFDLAS